nr:hypothetical protein [Chthoniobacterales bacterium]
AARPVDLPDINNAIGGDGSDIGAVEVGPLQPGPTFTVTNTAERDSGCTTDDCTLLEAMNAANAGADANTITFAPGLSGVIRNTLVPGGLNIIQPLTINGPGARTLTVSGNDATRIFNLAKGISATISGLTLTGGRASGSTFPANSGAAITNAGALTLTECTVAGNTASGHGGAIYNNGGNGVATLNVANSTLSGNVASGVGGAVFSSANAGQTTINLTNSTFSQNGAGEFGGAIYQDSNAAGNAALRVANCTFDRNTAAINAGVIYNDALNPSSTGTATVTLRNTILRAGASGANLINDSNGGGTITSEGANISSDSAGGDGGTGPGGFLNAAGDKRNTDPKLDTLKNNGGPTDTTALLTGSTAIDAGNDANAPAGDQRGYGRTGISDIGAFEFAGTLPVTLANISTRLRVESGDNVLIGGFIVTGTAPKRLLARAIGPSLPFADALANPKLEVFDSAGTLVGSNDNWQDSADQQAIFDTGIPPSNSLESAVIGSVAPGAYTAIVSGADGGTGPGLVEIYDLNRTVDSKLANISTRGLVQTGDNVMIGGFIVLGTRSQKLIVRALGPSLPVNGKLNDPLLEIYDGNGVRIAVNNNWRETQAADIAATGIPPDNDLESAIVGTVPPDAYTAIVRGVGDTTGVALIEVYALP